MRDSVKRWMLTLRGAAPRKMYRPRLSRMLRQPRRMYMVPNTRACCRTRVPFFQFKAPDAQKVEVPVGGGKYPMMRGSDGVWTVTTPPLVVGFHYYSLLVDGAAVNDPGSYAFFGTSKDASGLEVH